MKIYVMACPGAGKSKFRNRVRGRVGKFDLKEHDEFYGESFEAYNSDRLLELNDNTCMLGKVDTPRHPKIIYCAVVLPEEALVRNLDIRREELQDDTGWNNQDIVFNHPDEGYYRLCEVVEKYNIKKFTSFEELEQYLKELTAEKIEPMTQRQLEGVCEELKFWKGFVKTKRFSGWIANSPTPELCEYAQEKILSMNPITILDVGSGPVSILTGLTGAKLTTADLLGDFYQLIFDFEKHGITPPVAIPAEQLILDRKFDLVHMSNALDHCQDPELVIQRLWNLVDFGGHLMIQGFVDEGKYERYRGLHSWDLGVYRGRITCNGADISEVGTAEEFSRNNRQWFVWYSQKSRV